MLTSLFALELCVRLVPGMPLRHALQQLVFMHPEHAGHQDRHVLYSQITDLLGHNLNLAERGCWEYFDDHQRAQSDYEMWSKGMLTEEGARTSPSGPPDPYRPEPRYLTFTIAMLLVQGSATDKMMKNVCHIPEPELWYRRTFGRILTGMRSISFASVRSDILYLIPGDEAWGLTLEDLATPKFEYLRPIANA